MDSIMSMRVLDKLSQALRLRIPPKALIERRTLSDLAAYVDENMPSLDAARADEAPDRARSTLVTLRKGGSREPFFCVHPMFGVGIAYQSLAKHLGDDYPIHSFDAPGATSDEPPCDDIHELARRHVASMREAQPKGPYRLGGFSFGVIVAFEMAQQLVRAGEEVRSLVLVDMPAPAGPGQTTRSFGTVARLFGFPLDTSALQALDVEAQADQMANAFAKLVMLPEDIAGSSKIVDMYRAHFKGIARYEPARYPGKITFIRGGELVGGGSREQMASLDPSYGWAAFSDQPVRLLEIAGNHFNLIFEPVVRDLARLVRRALDEDER
jgi:thioesterase domain-containing protein